MAQQQTQPTQLDRIEAKLDSLLVLTNAAMKLAMPKVPAAMREAAVKLMAKGIR